MSNFAFTSFFSIGLSEGMGGGKRGSLLWEQSRELARDLRITTMELVGTHAIRMEATWTSLPFLLRTLAPSTAVAGAHASTWFDPPPPPPPRFSSPFVSRVLGRVFSDGPKHAPAGGSTHKHSQTSCWTSSDRHVHVRACATCIRASEAVLAERRRGRRCGNDPGAWKEVRKRTEGMADGS